MAVGTQVYPFAEWVDSGSSSGTQVYPFAEWVEPSAGGFQAAWNRPVLQFLGGGDFLMYPRNAASPPRIAIGAVVQISDGAVQSSGVSVVVRAEGGSETAGGGTVSYGGSSSVVYYAPTQAETNYTAFVVTAYKTGCIPVSVTVVTTASATSGTTNVAAINSVATSSVTTVNANVGTTQPLNFTGTGGSALVKSDTVDIAGAAVSTTSAQIGVNVVNVNAVSAASVTTINANIGTTQPTNFTGTGASALVKSDTVDIAGAAVATGTAQIGVNVVNFGGSAGTFSSGKPAVTLASTDVTGNIAADLQTIKTQTVTCAGGVTVPAATLASTTNITAGTVTTATNVTTVNGLANNVVTAASIASGALIAAVWDGSISGHTTTGTFGGALNAAGSAGDPWATTLPGAYSAGTAGYIVGTNLDATVGSRAPSATALSTSVWTGTLATNIGTTNSTVATNLDTTVSSRSTLTQTQVTGGAYTIQSASCVLGDARIANLDATVSSRLAPTTAGRTLDVTATGAAGIDWGNVENPTTTLVLSGTTIGTVTSAALSAAGNNAVADATLGRNIAGGSSTGRTVSQAMYVLRNKVDTETAPGYMIVFQTDDTTESWRAAQTTDAAAEPIVASAPTS